jgi:peptidoglycan hydrolase-like protein with peptidoglycan-binding domain
MADIFEYGAMISGVLGGVKRVITIAEKVAAPEVDLSPGVAAAEVRMLELCLVKLKYLKATDVNGLWDYTTESGVRAFQTAWGLKADAKYGTNSRAALKKALAGQKPPPKPSTSGNTSGSNTSGSNTSGSNTTPQPTGDQGELPPPLNYPGGKDAHGYKDVGGKIEWVHAKPANAEYWNKIKEKDLHHWVKENDTQYHCADLPAGDIYGPMVSFKVAFVGTGTQCGGLIKITLSNGAVIGLLHFSTFNVALKHAQASGAALPAGTYLGSTAKKIGLTSGPHLHTQGHNKDGVRVDRKTWLKWMHGEEGVVGFPLAANAAPDVVEDIKPEPVEDDNTESFVGKIKGPAGPMKSWPFKLKRNGDPVDQAGLKGGTTTNKFQGGVWLSGAQGEFKFENLLPADYEIEVLLPIGKLVAAESALPPGLDTGHRAKTPDPIHPIHSNESPEDP